MTGLEKTRQTIVMVSERLADESDYETKIQPALERARDFLEEQNAALTDLHILVLRLISKASSAHMESSMQELLDEIEGEND